MHLAHLVRRAQGRSRPDLSRRRREPAVDLPFAGYFDCKNEPFTRPLSSTPSRKGATTTRRSLTRNLARSSPMKAGRLLSLRYTTFPKARKCHLQTRVIAGGKRRTGSGRPHPGQLRSARLGPGPRERRRGRSAGRQRRLDGRQTRRSGAITMIRVRLEVPPAPSDRDVLRSIVFQIRWDDERASAVWSPLGDSLGRRRERMPTARCRAAWPKRAGGMQTGSCRSRKAPSSSSSTKANRVAG